MRRLRTIPVLLLSGGGLYKTVKFANPKYLGDPINTVKLFNEKGADEIVLLDIGATPNKKGVDFKKIAEIAEEAFMPLAYGGGIKTFQDAQRVFNAGFEKVVLGTAAFEKPELITEIAENYGSQSVVVSIDPKRGWFGKAQVYVQSGKQRTNTSPGDYARRVESLGAGEILVNTILRDGTWEGYDLPLVRSVTEAVKIPVIACGGASCLEDFRLAVVEGGASAVAAGSLFVYQKKGMGVLINFPEEPLVLKS